MSNNIGDGQNDIVIIVLVNGLKIGKFLKFFVKKSKASKASLGNVLRMPFEQSRSVFTIIIKRVSWFRSSLLLRIRVTRCFC